MCMRSALHLYCCLVSVAVTLQAAAALVPAPERCVESAALLLAQMPLPALQRGGALHGGAAGEHSVDLTLYSKA